MEAALPERITGEQQDPKALLVDSHGKPAQSAAVEVDQSHSAVKKLAPNVDGKAKEDGQPLDASTLQQVQAPEAVSAMAGDSNGQASVQPVPVLDSAVAEAAVDEDSTDQSRKAFSALVKETCSTRPYPY